MSLWHSIWIYLKPILIDRQVMHLASSVAVSSSCTSSKSLKPPPKKPHRNAEVKRTSKMVCPTSQFTHQGTETKKS